MTDTGQARGAETAADEPRHDAFLSYAHQDREFALRLREALAERGKIAWQDESNIRPAERWRPAVARGIERADAFIAVLSPGFAASAECRKELEHAVALNKRVIPVVAVGVDRATLAPGLADLQFIPARGTFGDGFESAVRVLTEAIDTDLDWVREHTQWTLKALEWDAHRRDVSFGLAGTELEAAEQWLARQSGKRPQPTALASEYVLASRRQVTRRLRRTRAITAAALAVMTVLAVTAFVARDQAVTQSQIASSRQLAAESLLELPSDPQLSLLLGVQAAHVRHTPEALDALRRALSANHLVRTLQQGGSQVYGAALSPDGTLIATASKDNAVRVWTTGGRLLRVLAGHQGEILGIRFDATSRKVLTWAEDGTARLWSVFGAAPPVVMRSADYRVIHAAVSPDGRAVVTSTFLPSRPRVWSAATGRPLFALGEAAGPVPDVEFSPGGALIATSGVTGTVSLWNAATGTLSFRMNVAAGQPAASAAHVNEAVFSPDGRYLLVSASDARGNDPRSRVWDLRTRQPVTPPLAGGDASWSPDGSLVITTGTDGDARVWDASGGGLVSLLHGPDRITGPALLSPDSGNGAPEYAITGSENGTADLWNPVTGTLAASLAGTAGAVTPVAFSADAGQAVTYGTDGGTRIWSTEAVVPEPSPQSAGLRRAVAAAADRTPVPPSPYLAADPAAPLAAFYDTSGTPARPAATVVDARTGATVARLTFPYGSAGTGLTSGYVSFDARGTVMLVSGAGPGQLRAARGGRLLRTLTGPGSDAASGSLSADGSLAATTDVRGLVAVWDVATGRRLMAFTRKGFGDNGFGVTGIGLEFSPDGTLLLCSGQNGVSYVLRARTGQVLNEIHGPAVPPRMVDMAMGGAISPDDQYVVTTAGWDNDAHVYRVGQPGEVVTLRGHTDGIDDAAFSPDGTLIATTAGHTVCDGGDAPLCDNSTRVWDLQQSAPLLTLPGGGGARVAFSADGTTLLASTFQAYLTADPGATAPFPPADTFPYDTLACVVCGGFDRLVPLAERAETRQLTPAERLRFGAG